MAGACKRAILSASAVRRKVCGMPQAGLLVLSLSLGAPPVLAGEGDLAEAKAEFRTYCSACHGPDGRGNGPAAQALKARPPDLTQLTRRAGGTFPKDQVFEKIEGLGMPTAHGTSDMPVWGERFVEEELGDGVSLEAARSAGRTTLHRINRLVNYLKAIQQ